MEGKIGEVERLSCKTAGAKYVDTGHKVTENV